MVQVGVGVRATKFPINCLCTRWDASAAIEGYMQGWARGGEGNKGGMEGVTINLSLNVKKVVQNVRDMAREDRFSSGVFKYLVKT